MDSNEDEPREEILREYAQIKTQILKMRIERQTILTGDFNAKLIIKKPNCQ
jgi:hypothetical protein